MEKINDGISGIDYAKKMKIIENLNIYTPAAINIFWKVNDLRVAFAHHYPENDSKYKYFRKSVFERRTVEKLIEDMRSVFSEEHTFIRQSRELKNKKF
ncbi:MAG: hypothetical protein V1933_08195 [Candidatus Omnitrophota bacterium]